MQCLLISTNTMDMVTCETRALELRWGQEHPWAISLSDLCRIAEMFGRVLPR